MILKVFFLNSNKKNILSSAHLSDKIIIWEGNRKELSTLYAFSTTTNKLKQGLFS